MLIGVKDCNSDDQMNYRFEKSIRQPLWKKQKLPEKSYDAEI